MAFKKNPIFTASMYVYVKFYRWRDHKYKVFFEGL